METVKVTGVLEVGGFSKADQLVNLDPAVTNIDALVYARLVERVEFDASAPVDRSRAVFSDPADSIPLVITDDGQAADVEPTE